MFAPSTGTRRAGACLRTLIVLAAVVVGAAAPARGQTAAHGWTVEDVGEPEEPGHGGVGSSGIWATSTGDGVDGASDQFTFVHRTVKGDATVIARLQHVGYERSPQVGVMVRESLQATARHGFLFGSPNGGLTFSSRNAVGDDTTSVAGSTGAAATSTPTGTWLRIVRARDVLTVSRSTDGASWTVIGTAVMPQMATSVYVGVAVARRDAAYAYAGLTRVAVVGNGALEAGFRARDVGAPALYGGSWSESGSAMLAGAGSGISGTTDQFRYLYRAITGDMDIVARLQPAYGNPPTSRAGLMVRKGTSGGAIHFSLLADSQGTADVVSREVAGKATSVAASEAMTGANWLKLSRRGTTVTALQSFDGYTWIEVGSQEMTAATYNVGLVVASGQPTTWAQATFDDVTLTFNEVPTVRLTEPDANVTVAAPAWLTLAATANDEDGTVVGVDFYADSALVGTDATSPYAITWNVGAPGTYKVTAVVRDDDGATRTSSARRVTVFGNALPSVTLTAPSNGSVLTQPPSITLTAQAADADGPVASVEFYAGTVLLGVDQTSPYSFKWNGPPVGTHAITAVARDALGALAVSEAATVTVASAGAPSTAIFTPASIHAVVDRYVLAIYPAGSNPAVATPVATVDLGRPPVIDNECRADVRAAIAALPPGNYIAAVTAQSTQEGDLRSAPSPTFTR